MTPQSGSGVRLGDKYVLGEELGRGAYGQVCAVPQVSKTMC